METYAVSPTAFTNSSSRSSFNGMSSEDFFKLLVTEMQQQDPFEPTKTEDMIGQVSQLRSIELSDQLNQTLSQMTSQQGTSGASDMIGKLVAAATIGADGNPTSVNGVVTGVRFLSDGTALLELDTGYTVRMADVMWVTTLDNADGLEPPADEDPESTDKDEQVSRDRAAPTRELPFKLSASLTL